MVAHQVLFVPRVLLHPLVVVYAFKHHLTKTIEVRQIGHLMIKEKFHEFTGLCCIVDLEIEILWSAEMFISDGQLSGENEKLRGEELTCVHLFTPYFTIKSLVMGADTFTIWCL